MEDEGINEWLQNNLTPTGGGARHQKWDYRISMNFREKKQITKEKNAMVEKGRRKYGEAEESSHKKKR